MTLGIDLYQQELDRYRAQQAGLMNQAMGIAQQRQIQMGQIYGMGIATPGPEYLNPTKEQVYEKELIRLKKQTSQIVDASLGVGLAATIVIGGMVTVLGLKWVAVGTLSIMGGVGLYLGLHKAVFAYRKRAFDLAQATKAMLE